MTPHQRTRPVPRKIEIFWQVRKSSAPESHLLFHLALSCLSLPLLLLQDGTLPKRVIGILNLKVIPLWLLTLAARYIRVFKILCQWPHGPIVTGDVVQEEHEHPAPCSLIEQPCSQW